MRVTLAYGRSQLLFTNDHVTVTTGGSNTLARTLYLAIQGQNHAGSNLLSSIVGPITINPGEQLNVTIPAAAKLPAEGWTNFVISSSPDSNPENFGQIAKIAGDTALPATVIFDSDADFGQLVITSPANLPPNPVNGALYAISSLNGVFGYDEASTTTPNNVTVLLGTGNVGRWLRQGATFSTYLASITDPGGCAQDISELEVAPAQYSGDNSVGATQKYWLINDSGIPVPQGTRVGLVVRLDEEPKTSLFSGRLKVTFRGYANPTTGELRVTYTDTTDFPLLNQELNFQAQKSNLVLPDDLAPGEAYVLDIYPQYSRSAFRYPLLAGMLLRVEPLFYEEAGDYSEAGELIGDVIYPKASRCLVVPQTGLRVKVLSGAGMVKSISFPVVGDNIIDALASNAADQIIAIDGNGVSSRVTTLSSTQAIRAKVGTVNGDGQISDWSDELTIADNETITVTCYYPCNVNGKGTIRSEYPDTRLVGNSQGDFNPTGVIIYLKRLADGEIRRFAEQGVVANPSQDFFLPNWADGTDVAQLPELADLNFGLFAPGVVEINLGVGASDYEGGTYQAAFLFRYTNTVTSITHDETAGCIPTMEGDTSLAATITRSQYWGEPVASLAMLRSLLPSQRTSGQQRYVLGEGTFVFDGIATIGEVPDDNPTIGRWLLLPGALSLSDVGEALVLDSLAQLKALSTSDRAILAVRVVDDAVYIYSATSTATADDVEIVSPNNNVGRWQLVKATQNLTGLNGISLVEGKAFEFYSPQTNLKIQIQPGFDIDITSGAEAIALYRWSQLPDIPGTTGRESSPVLLLPNTGGTGRINVTSNYRWISIAAKDVNNSNIMSDCNFVVNGNVVTLIGYD